MVRTAIGLLAILVFLCPRVASADPRAAAVLETEQRWLRAISDRDAAALASILGDHFVHINYRGEIIPREGALAAAKAPQPYVQQVSDETVDFAGDVAIVRGINTVSQNGSVVIRLRFTDVFEFQNGKWIAQSAQETAIQ